MTPDRFEYLRMFCDRIEDEIYRNSIEFAQLSEFDFRTAPEGQVMRCSKRLKDLAAYFDKKMDEIARRRNAA